MVESTADPVVEQFGRRRNGRQGSSFVRSMLDPQHTGCASACQNYRNRPSAACRRSSRRIRVLHRPLHCLCLGRGCLSSRRGRCVVVVPATTASANLTVCSMNRQGDAACLPDNNAQAPKVLGFRLGNPQVPPCPQARRPGDGPEPLENAGELVRRFDPGAADSVPWSGSRRSGRVPGCLPALRFGLIELCRHAQWPPGHRRQQPMESPP